MTCSLPVIEYGKELKKLEADGLVKEKAERFFSRIGGSISVIR